MVLFTQIKDNHIVRLSGAVEGRVEKVTDKGASILLAVGRLSQVLGYVQCVHLNGKDSRYGGGNGREDGNYGCTVHYHQILSRLKEYRCKES